MCLERRCDSATATGSTTCSVLPVFWWIRVVSWLDRVGVADLFVASMNSHMTSTFVGHYLSRSTLCLSAGFSSALTTTNGGNDLHSVDTAVAWPRAREERSLLCR